MPRNISWSGYTWVTRGASTGTTPGPNDWDETVENVSVQPNGEIRLGIIPIGTSPISWKCVEIAGPALGYGQYDFVLNSDPSDWWPGLVLGLFVYDNTDPMGPFSREIDFVEITKWGLARERSICWFTLQPSGTSHNIYGCHMGKKAPQVITGIWEPGSVYFRTTEGNRVWGEHLVKSGVPDPGDATIRLQLWLYQVSTNPPPTDTPRMFVSLSSFKFEPDVKYFQPAASDRVSVFSAATSPCGFNFDGDGFISDSYTGTGDGAMVLPARNIPNLAYTGNVYNLAGSAVDVKIIEVPPAIDATNESRFQLRYDPSNYFQMGTLNGNLVSKKIEAAVTTLSSVVYSAASHKYWRIRELGGTVYYETSPNRTAWTTRWSTTHTFGTKLNSMRVWFESDHDNTQGAPGHTVIGAINHI